MLCFGLIIMFCEPQPDKPPPPPSTYCQTFKPIRWHAADTRKTKEAIDTEDRKWKRLCAPPKTP